LEAFVGRVAALLTSRAPEPPVAEATRARAQIRPVASRRRAVWLLAACFVVAGGAFVAVRLLHPAHEAAPSASPADSAGGHAGGLPVVTGRSIAVLPFLNLSEDRSNDYFSDGLSEELIDLLTRIPGLQVAARTSSFYFKGRQVPIAEITNALGVTHVLEGSVRQSERALRVTAQLVRADTGYHVWSQTYDRQIDDIFRIQEDVALAVVSALKVSLLDGIAPRRAPTRSVEAYTLYLRALGALTVGGLDDYQVAIARLHAATKADPRFADAWASLGSALSFKQERQSVDPAECREARAATDRALALDPDLEAALLASGLQYMYCESNNAAAEAVFQRALERAAQCRRGTVLRLAASVDGSPRGCAADGATRRRGRSAERVQPLGARPGCVGTQPARRGGGGLPQGHGAAARCRGAARVLRQHAAVGEQAGRGGRRGRARAGHELPADRAAGRTRRRRAHGGRRARDRGGRARLR
jgi:TolB-like protein